MHQNNLNTFWKRINYIVKMLQYNFKTALLPFENGLIMP